MILIYYFYSKLTSKFLSELLKTKVCQRKYDKIRTRIAIFGSKQLGSEQALFQKKTRNITVVWFFGMGGVDFPKTKTKTA